MARNKNQSFKFKFNTANSRGLNLKKIAIIKNAFQKGKVDVYFIQEIQHKNLQKFLKIFGPEYEICSNEHTMFGTACIYKKANKHRLEITPFNTSSFQGQKILVKNDPEQLKIIMLYIPPSLELTEENVQKVIVENPDILTGDFNCRHEIWSKKGKCTESKESLRRNELFQTIIEKLELISAFTPSTETLKNCKNELIGSVDAILLKPSCNFRAQARDFLSDHRELSLTLDVSNCSGLGEMPKKESKYFVDYEKMSKLEIKKWWELKINALEKPSESINCTDFIKLFGELINELWTPKFKKKDKVDPEIELLESSASQDEFFEELCKNAPPEELWGILNRVKNSKNKEKYSSRS